MKLNKLLGLSAALLAISSSANALDSFPIFTPIPSVGSAPSHSDWNFWTSNESVSLTSNTSGIYTLTATATGPVTFLYGGHSYSTSSNSVYSLSATFNAQGGYIANVAGSDNLTITGYFNAAQANLLGNNAPTSTSTLLAANLTAFGFGTSQDTLGFKTVFTNSWAANQGIFTGGSTGEGVYLYDESGLTSSGAPITSGAFTNQLGALVNAFAAQNLSTVNGFSANNIDAIAAVPVPFSGLLFGTGLTALLGLSRRRSA